VNEDKYTTGRAIRIIDVRSNRLGSRIIIGRLINGRSESATTGLLVLKLFPKFIVIYVIDRTEFK